MEIFVKWLGMRPREHKTPGQISQDTVVFR